MEVLNNIKQNGFECIYSYPISAVVEACQIANDAYHNNNALISDALYDSIIDYIASQDEENEIIHSIGASVPDKDERKTHLPYPMASMNKIKDTDTLTRFISQHRKSSTWSITDKLDGISLMYDTKSDNTRIQLYTRGNGTIGMNVSHLVEYLRLPFVPDVVIRGELIISK